MNPVISLLLLAIAIRAQEMGSAVCAQCHPTIAKRYAQTPMARTSGRVSAIRTTVPNTPIADPSTQSTVRLKLNSAGALTLNLQRESPSLSADRDLTWFIGSGRIGRSFLFEQEDGFLYQSPISYYADGDTYRASPGFERKGRVDLTRAVQPSCLLCHASRLQPVAGTHNRYDNKQPFLEPGISCERCHGPGQRHVAAMKATPRANRTVDRAIVNPSKLRPAERDSVCAQCHLTGAARIARVATKGRSSYVPGEDLARSVAVFAWEKAQDLGLTVTSHFETLSLSRCKQRSGDRLWCGTCHSAHGTPVDVRARCVACHSAERTCTVPLETRQARNNDQCHNCHMPKSDVRDVQHAVYTDHAIPRNTVSRSSESIGPGAGSELVPFWQRVAPDPRDLALGYAVIALTEPSVRRRAFDMLRSAEAKDPSDNAIAAQLAQFYDRMGQPGAAVPLYERVVAADPSNTSALTNLGTIYAQANRLPEAAALWQRSLAANPALTQARMNLAVAQLRQGQREAGIASLRLALVLDPDNAAVAEMLRQLQ